MSFSKYGFLLVPFFFYLFTMSPTIGLGDTALLLEAIEEPKINSHVNNHNLTNIIGWLFLRLPFGDLPYRGNLTSAAVGALTVALFYLLLLKSFGSRLTAVIGALILMVSHSMWWHSTIVECYAVNALFTVLALYLLNRIWMEGSESAREPAGPRATEIPPDPLLDRSGRRSVWSGWTSADGALCLLFLVAGLSVFNHVQMGTIAVAATIILASRLWTDARAAPRLALTLVIFSTLCFAIGLLPYLLTFLRDVSAGGDLGHATSQAAVGSFQSIMLKGTWSWAVTDLSYLISKQFPAPTLLLVPVGLVALARSWRGSAALAAVLAMLVINTGFFMFYNTWDKFAFLLPSFIILAYAMTYAVHAIHTWLRQNQRPLWTATYAALMVFSLLFPIYLYSQLSTWGSEPGPWYARYNNRYTENSHNAAEYIANPNKYGYQDIQEFAYLVFRKLPAEALLIDDDSRTYYPVRYLQSHTGLRPDLQVRMVNSWGFSGWGWSEKHFADVLTRAYRQDLPVFLITVDWPFNQFIVDTAHRGQELQFERFELSPSRWIYRLKTRSELADSAGAPFRPIVQALRTGVRFNTSNPVGQERFTPDEAIMAALDFELNGTVFPVRFRWLTPVGEVFFESESFFVPISNTRTWSFLEKPDDIPQGRWTVQAFSDSVFLAESHFMVAAN